MMPIKALGKNIRYLRKVKGLTQEELASKAGMSTMSIRRYEAGERIATEENVKRIAKALGVDETTILPKSSIFEMSVNELGVMAKYAGDSGEPIYTVDEAKQKLNEMFDMLNVAGQKEALKRINELCEVPRYQCTHDKPTSDEVNTTQLLKEQHKTAKQRFDEFKEKTSYQENLE